MKAAITTKGHERMRSVIGMFRKELAGKSTAEWLAWTRGPVRLASGAGRTTQE